MSKLPKKPKIPIMIRFAASFCLGALCVLLVVIASSSPSETKSAFGAWSRSVSIFLSGVFSLLPIPVAELLLYGFILLALITLVRAVVRIFRWHSARPLLAWLSSVVLTAACLVFLFLSLWGLNYYATPLASEMDIPDRSPQTLFQTAVWLRDEMNLLAPQVNRDQDGVTDAGGFEELAARAALGYDALADAGGDYARGLAPPKRPMFPALLMRFGIAGIYVPFTGEALVDDSVMDSHLPFSFSHELAHRQGTAPEDEANYHAFLACVSHPDVIYRYSGYYVAFIYCSNALAGADPELFSRLWEEVSPLVRNDMQAQSERLKKYEGPLQEMGEAVNNTYLETMGQEQGARSYGLVVDMLIVEYMKKVGKD